ALADALAEGEHQALDGAHFHDALEQAPRHETQCHRVDEAEEAVAADREAEELRVLGPAAGEEPPARVDELDRLDVADDRRQREAAAVGVGGERAAERQAVGAGLLLVEGPFALARLRVIQRLQKLRPLHAGFDFDQPALVVEGENPGELARIDQHAVGGEGLRAHGVAAAGNTQGALVGGGQLQRRAHAVEALGLHDAVDPGRRELAVHVVDQDALGLLLPPGARGRPDGRGRGEAQKFPAIAHRILPSVFAHSRMQPCKRKSLTPATRVKNLSTRRSGQTISAGARAAWKSSIASRSPTAARRAISRSTRTASSWSSTAARCTTSSTPRS